MEAKFWLDRWAKDDIGFHRDVVNAGLQTQWPTLALAPQSSVFVPLCGKTGDMAWLANAGHRVIGVELSERALLAFFADRGLQPVATKNGNHTIFSAGPYELWCGDLFTLPPATLADVAGIYDRASLVALPPAMQQQYADFAARHYPADTPVLLVALDYDETEMDGPPFSIPPERLDALFAEHFTIETRSTNHALEQNDNLRKRGLTALRESCYVLRRKP